MPTKRSGRPEPPAISVMLIVEVLLAKIVVRRADLVQLAEQVVLDRQALEHRLDHQVAVGEVFELGRAAATAP